MLEFSALKAIQKNHFKQRILFKAYFSVCSIYYRQSFPVDRKRFISHGIQSGLSIFPLGGRLIKKCFDAVLGIL